MLGPVTRGLAGLLLAAVAGASGAQQAADPVAPVTTFSVPAAAIVTVDIDRLFSLSRFGQRIGDQYAKAREELAIENRRIADGLRAEELALTAQRAEMDVTVFRSEAEAFDEKAQGIRRAQDAKETALEQILSHGREQFLDVSRPILGQLMIDRGAVAILDRRSVVLSLGSIDVTESAIARINTAIGDGSGIAPDETPAQPLDETQSVAPEN